MNGTVGPAGMNGSQGPVGPMGVQGPSGAVLVLDGGVVTGPAGSSVISSPVPVGDAICAFGGVRLTQLSDAGVTHVCSGATGAAGPQGPIGPTGMQGSIGPIGPQGIQGMQGTIGPAGPTGMQGATGAQGPIGLTGPQGNQGIAGPAGAQGIQGPIGNAGPTGSPGAQGIAGSTGPAGPAGAVLYLDGGAVLVRGGTGRPTYAGITAFTTNGAPTGPGAQLGRLSLNARCNAEFAGSHICTDYEWAESTPIDAVPAPGAWLEYSNTDNTRTSTNGGCTSWTATSGSRIITTQTGATVSSPTSPTCAAVLPIACCRAPTSATFRGLTAFVTNGAPSGPGAQLGRLSMNARCHAEFSGSHICTDYEWAQSTPNLPVPASGAWLEYSNTDNSRTSTNGGCTSWTATSGSRIVALQTGATASSPFMPNCASTLPIACCE